MRDKLTLEIPANEGRIVATVFASHRFKGVEIAGSKINNGPISIIPLNKKMLNKTKINYYVKDREICDMFCLFQSNLIFIGGLSSVH